MSAAITISNIVTDGSTLAADVQGTITTHADITVTLTAKDGDLPAGTYRLEMYDGLTLLASTVGAGGTPITITAGVGTGVLSTRTTAAQAAMISERIAAVLVLHDDAAAYAPARIPVNLVRNEVGQTPVALTLNTTTTT